jgi:hypothetical protein
MDMRTITTSWILIFVCCGLAQAAGDVPESYVSDSGERLIIPSTDDAPSNAVGDAWNQDTHGVPAWQSGKQTTGNRSTRPASSNKATTFTTPEQGNSGSHRTRLTVLSQPWIILSMVLGGLGAATVASVLVRRWVRGRRARSADRFAGTRGTRASAPTVLAASLIQKQLRSDQLAETEHDEEPKRTRRAA